MEQDGYWRFDQIACTYMSGLGKQLVEACQKVKEAEAKITQGSQQTQGEALELEIEELLREAFRDDEISEVKKGQRGADITEKVTDRRGRNCGTILWETKNGR